MKHLRIAAVAAALILGAAPQLAFAADPTTLTVSGAGSISRAPDNALVELSLVTNDDASAARATAANNTAYNGLRDRLHALGVRDDALRTTSINVHYVPRPAQLRQPLGGTAVPGLPQQYGYLATRSLEVTAPRVDGAGAVIDAAVAAGANVNGVRYTLADQRGAVAQALAAAVADAAMQAEAVAQAAHLHITGIKSIDVSSAPSPVFFAARAVEPASAPTEIDPSPLDVRASVSVTYLVAP
jgi:uncharacterized protein YggE